MMSKFTTGIIAAAGLAFAVSASAQAPAAPAPADAQLPFCSAKVKDRCIQKSDVKRERAAAAKKG